MFKPLRTNHPAIKHFNNALVDLPAPTNISIMWNFGSLLSMCLGIQIVTGLFLAMHYTPNIEMAFSSCAHISRDVNWGWIIRSIHANGASMFFLLLYLHTGRGMYYGSYLLMETWNIGVILFILTMATAFMGYVLPWGQMSFWGATVITNLFSAIPYIGKTLVEWMWGGFAVDNPTLNRFFALHFILPFAIAAFIIIHLLFLHQSGSNNPLGINSDSDRIPFHMYFSLKDLLEVSFTLLAFMIIIMFLPSLLTDPENFIMSNPLVTPIHIKPEWYFLWVYAILRSIPNKLGGVLALFAALLILFMLPLTNKFAKQSNSFYPINQFLFWSLVSSWMILTWIGGRPVEDPYITIGQLFTLLYFMYYIINPITASIWDKLTKT